MSNLTHHPPAGRGDPWFQQQPQQRFRTGSMASGMNNSRFNVPPQPIQTLPRNAFDSRFQPPPLPPRNVSTSVFNLNQAEMGYLDQMNQWNAMQQVGCN